MGSTSVADLFIILDSVTDPFSRGMKRAAADAEEQSRRMSSALGLVTKVGLGVGLAVGGIAVASVKAAADFQANMTKLSTAAGAPKAAVQAATGEILKLGTQVGMTGTQMAEALYHPVSAGLDMATSLQVVKYAAMEAQISGANLDDTTYSLSSVMKAFNQPASQAAQTMATLNAVVGDGDMRFQDFNVSIKNWAPTAAQMGISIQSMGAGLAYLTDRGNTAEEASTRLTMGLSMMATPSHQAAKLLEGLGVASADVKGSTQAMTDVLKSSGITQNQLAADLAKPDGLYVALSHLEDALHKAGVKGTEADSAIAKIFGGGRSDKAIMSLLQNLDGVKQKFDQIGSDSTTSKFQANWESTKQTFAFQLQQMKVAAENFGIQLGTKLLPHLSGFITAGESGLGQLASGFTGAATAPVAHPNLHNALLNREAAIPPPLTAWQRFGIELHTIVGDVERFGTRMKPIGEDFLHFGQDAWQAILKLGTALTPTVKLLGEGLFGALVLVGKTLANVAGPALKDFADFLSNHQGMIKFFAEVILGGLIVKMTVLGGIKAAQGILGVATSIAQFPLGQVGQITTALGGLKAAWSGQAAADGEKAITGLKGALTGLKDAASGVLDKFPLFDTAKTANLARVAGDMKGIETAAAGAPAQLSLFETDLTGIVQVAEKGPEQLALFETGLSGVGGEAAKAETATGGLAGKLGKFALAGGVVGAALVGIGLLADQLGKMAGVGDHTALGVDRLATQLQLAGGGSAQARDEFTRTAVALVTMSNMTGKSMSGLNDMDQALTQLVAGGHAKDAKAQFDAITLALAKTGVDAAGAASKFPQYEQALKNAGSAAQTADGQVSALQSTLANQQAITQFSNDLQNLTQAAQTNGKSIFDNTQQAVANQQAFQQGAQDVLNYYQQQRNANVPITQATADMQKQVDQLEATGIQAGFTKGDVDKYLKALGLIPSNIGTTITANTDPALNAAQALLNRIGRMVGTVTITGDALPTRTSGPQAKASGGPVGMLQSYWVGENGPELFTPGASGYITPTEMIRPAVLAGAAASGAAGYGPGGGASVVNHYYYAVHVAGSVTTEQRLVDVIRTNVLQYKGRNSTNGWG